jgi:hypothetical protein
MRVLSVSNIAPDGSDVEPAGSAKHIGSRDAPLGYVQTEVDDRLALAEVATATGRSRVMWLGSP